VGLDLHVHSVYSDGALTPEEIVDTAVSLGLSAVAITDHDNISGLQAAYDYVKKLSIEQGHEILEIVPGIEINTLYEGNEVHILGYFPDLKNKPLLDMISYQQHARVQQITEIVKRLNKIAKIKISLEDITKLVHEKGSIGRPHIARAILNVEGVSSIIEAYKKYINDDAPTYIKRKTVTPHEAVETIYEAGGVAVLAHPHDLVSVEEILKDLMNYGLRGIEVYHRRHSPAMIEYFSSLADKYNLIITGGSDCHGTRLSGQLYMGKTHVPDWVLEELKKEKNRIEIASG
jgi:hypothetical protein